MLTHLLFQISVESFFRIELWAVTGQVEQINQVLAFSHPCLHKLAVMPAQVVHNKKDFFVRILDQSLQKFNKLVDVEHLINDHPARFTLVSHRGNHRELLASAADSHGHRCFAHWCV